MDVLTSADIGRSEWWKSLSESGIIPPRVRRMIIDISLNEIVRVYYETDAEEPLLAHLPSILQRAKLIDVGKLTKAAQTDGGT